MRTPRRPRRAARTTSLALVALVAAALVFAVPVRGAGESVLGAASSAWRAAFSDRPQPPVAPRMLVVLSAPSLADRLGPGEALPRPEEQRRWTAEAKAAQRAVIETLRRRGIAIRPEHSFTRTLNGFSALVDPRALAELERVPGVEGVYPVRTVYPASIAAETLTRPEFGPGSGRRPEVPLPRLDGEGVTIALLDTGVDLGHPFLRGRVLPGVDVVGKDRLAAAEPKPDEPSRLEGHGTRMAGILVGSDGPGGLTGVAPRASVLPIRVVGWQQERDGSFALFGYGDQLIAGLERAVDPDGDGDAEDAARVAAAPVVEPYAAFPRSPEARAVRAASRLGTLVVAAAGNDGPAGAGFGTIGGPGGAPAALTVGALDARRDVLEADATLRVGLGAVFAGRAPLLGPLAPRRPISVAVAALGGPTLGDPFRPRAAQASGDVLADFFDPRGVSVVAGRAVLLRDDGRSLAAKARNATAAGAEALLVYGSPQPAARLDLDEENALPVLALPDETGRALVAGLERGAPVTLTLGDAARVANEAFGEVGAFSSRGLAFDGRVKPDVVAPGVEIATGDAGANPDGEARFATVTGSSAAAAIVAGSAALVAQARPALGPTELKSLLVGSARRLFAGETLEPVTAQGAGVVDASAAVAAKLAVEPATLAFGRARGSEWKRERLVTVRNLTNRRLSVAFAVGADESDAPPVDFAADPARLALAPRTAARVRVTAAASVRGRGLASGALVVAARGVPPVRVPWAVAFRRGRGAPLVSEVRLSHRQFKPSLSAPVVLAFRAGRVVSTPDGRTVEPVSRLDVELWTVDGKRLGVLARLRQLLPGRYALGLTGRGPRGNELRPGTYVIRLRPLRVDGGPPAATADAVFAITR